MRCRHLQTAPSYVGPKSGMHSSLPILGARCRSRGLEGQIAALEPSFIHRSLTLMRLIKADAKADDPIHEADSARLVEVEDADERVARSFGVIEEEVVAG